MQKNLRSRLCSAAAVAVFAGGCAAAAGTHVAADDKRRPDGVAVDPLETPPPARDEAPATSGVVALRAPLGVDAAQATVRAFFDAIGREDGEALLRVLSIDAVWLNPNSRAREPAYSVFARRFGRLDYAALAGVTFWSEERVFEGDAALAAWSELVAVSSQPVFAPGAAAARAQADDSLELGDVVVRAPVSAGKSGTSALFGTEVVLALRRDDDRFVVHRIAEDFVLQP